MYFIMSFVICVVEYTLMKSVVQSKKEQKKKLSHHEFRDGKQKILKKKKLTI